MPAKTARGRERAGSLRPIQAARGRTNNGFRGLQRIDLASVRLGSSELVRDINRGIVFEVIRANQPISRAEISRMTGLQASTVSNIVDQLIEEHWVRDGGTAALRFGRPPTLVRLNDTLVMLAADIHPQRASVAVVDLNGNFLCREDLPVTSNARKTIDGIVRVMLRMKQAYPKHFYEGVGIALPGRVDPVTARLRFAPNLGWSGFDIKGAVERATGMLVEMDNEANACLLAEMWFGNMEGVRNAVLVTISEGIGAAILSNGELIYGRNNMAGELGHVPLDINGPKCHCNGRGCWEMYASSSAALRYYAEQEPARPARNIAELLELADQRNPAAVSALIRQAGFIGKGLRLISAPLAPQRILVAGDIIARWPLVGPVIEKAFSQSALGDLQPRIVPTHQADVANLRGAAMLVLRRHANALHSRAN